MLRKMNVFLWMVLLVSLIAFTAGDGYAREINTESSGTAELYKASAIGTTQNMINIGNWGYWFSHNGITGHDPFTGGSGGYYPRGTAGAVYEEGLVWGGIVDDPSSGTKLRVGGNTYRNGTQPGWWGSDPNDVRARIYRIRSDWATLTRAVVTTDAAELNNVSTDAVTAAMADEVIEQYLTDWKDWPTDLGAPYYDVDGNGQYNPIRDENDMPMIPEFNDDGTVKLDENGEPTGRDYPGIAQADQIMFYIINDDNAGRASDLYGSPPIGLEVQTTAWAYNQPTTGLGQIVFKKFKITNHSGFTIDSMYVSQWCDPDLGNYGDDLSGCDTTLSMMFAYNGFPTDGQYNAFGLAPAAVGYDFFQGPMVDGAAGDTAVFDLKKVPGKKNLPMTSYGYFTAGGTWSDPTLGEYEGTLQWYNLLRGFAPTDDVDNPTPFLVQTGDDAGQPTKYPFSGDPVTGAGDVDGTVDEPGDRRMLQCSGPFTMEDGDVQEVVVAVIGGLGASNTQSVADMKSTDDVAQTVYNSLFQIVPKPPEAPQVNAVALNDQIVLNWGWNESAVKKTEEPVIINYEFEGYNVYQMTSPTAGINDPSTVRVATFDKVNGVRMIKSSFFSSEFGTVVELPVQYGTDSGIQRAMVIEKDYINNDNLRRGTPYYFAVTAYNFDPNLIRDRALESSATVYTVTPQDAKPGFRYGVEEAGTDIEVTHTGPSDGQVVVSVLDPTQLTGHTYQVMFEVDDDTTSPTYDEVVYNVFDSTASEYVLTKQRQVESLTDGAVINVDGLNIVVAGPPPGLKATYETDGNDVVVDPYVSILVPSLGTTGYLLSNRAGIPADIGNYARDFDRFDFWGMDDVIFDFADSSLTWDYIGETIHFDTTDGSPYYAPFAVYRHIFSTGEMQRLVAGFWDTDGSGTWNIDGNWFGPIYGAPSYEPVYCWLPYDAAGNEISYDPANEAQYIADNDLYTSFYTTWGSATGPVTYPYITATLWTMYLSNATLPFGNKVWLVTNKPNTAADIFSFKAPATDYSQELAKEDVGNVNVFPNPYYAGNELETSRFNRFVTFNHLPGKATFRIFNLAGVQVRKLEKDSDSQFHRWDLLNETGLPVASGIYIVHVDMPDLGEEKVLKVVIVQAQQVLEYY